MGQHMVIFRDHATGFLKGYNLASEEKKQVALAAQNYFMLNIGKNHRVKEMVFDYNTPFFKRFKYRQYNQPRTTNI